MSKKSTGVQVMYTIFNETNWVSHMEGELLTLLETLGLPETQERAIKSLVRQRLWDSFHDWGHMCKREDYEGLIAKSKPTAKMGPVSFDQELSFDGDEF